MSKTPITYTGYVAVKDAEGKDTGNTTPGPTATGKDANSHVDPQAVKKALDNLQDAVCGEKGGITKIQKSLTSVSAEANGDMLLVDDATMEPIINGAAESLNSISTEIETLVDDIQTFAQKEHDDKQDEWNRDAYDSLKARSDVKRVIPHRP